MPKQAETAAFAETSELDNTIERFRAQVGYTRDEYNALEGNLRKHAWYVTRVANDRQANVVKGCLADALADGTGRGGFEKYLEERMGTFDDWYAEVVWRNNASTVYNAGRMEFMSRDYVQPFFPLWAYVAILDGRTSAICEDLAPTILPADDPRWMFIYPPNHDNCRSAVQPISAAQAWAEGISPVDFEFSDNVGIDARFATNPMSFLGMM